MILIDAIAFGLSVLIIELIVFLPTVDLIDAEPLNDLSAQLLLDLFINLLHSVISQLF